MLVRIRDAHAVQAIVTEHALQCGNRIEIEIVLLARVLQRRLRTDDLVELRSTFREIAQRKVLIARQLVIGAAEDIENVVFFGGGIAETRASGEKSRLPLPVE